MEIVKMDPAMCDDRGYIQSLLDKPIGSSLIIESHKGAIRANHYHKTDWHYCYMLRGAMEYFERPTGILAPPSMVLVGLGQMVFTQPMVDHAMRFLEDSLLIVLARNPRSQACYEADTVRVDMIR